MRPHRRVFVVGGANTAFLGHGHPDFVWRGHPDHGTRTNPTLEQHLATAVSSAFEVTGVDPTQVDKAWVGNFLGECFARQGHLGAMLAAVAPALEGKPIARVEAACASGAVAVSACIDALQAGCDVALAAGVEVETNVPGREGVDHMALAAHQDKQRHLDFALFPYLFARRAKHWRERYGATSEDVGRVVVKAYDNATRNPLALKHAVTVNLDDVITESEHNRAFLSDPDYRDHMRLLECTSFTDGASAVIVATAQGLDRLGVRPEDCTEIVSVGHTVRALGAEPDPTEMANVRHAASIAYRDAGVGADDLDVAEVHDCFAIAELQMMEALGLAAPGEGHRVLADGVTALDGSVPVNPGGGLLGFGHPIGATGVKQVVEVWRQMKERSERYQIARTPQVGLTANLGGDDRTAVVMIHRNVG